MYKVLEELNKTTGITGSMIVGSDGIVIAADLGAGQQDETLGALAASIMATARKSMERLKKNPLRQVSVEAEGAKIFLTDVGIGLLVVLTEPSVNIGLVRLEIRNAASQIKVK